MDRSKVGKADDVTGHWFLKTPGTDVVVLPLLGEGLRLTASPYPRVC